MLVDLSHGNDYVYALILRERLKVTDEFQVVVVGDNDEDYDDDDDDNEYPRQQDATYFEHYSECNNVTRGTKKQSGSSRRRRRRDIKEDGRS